ncbi:MAG: hypothetical protein KDN19_23480, partial [Verrucomicrobiae bacterium]|nr:hypothetical protein [Verrucomicrobiae bacterium]
QSLGSAWPYFIQIFVAGIEDSLPEGQEAGIDEAFLHRVYREHLIAGPRNKYLPHMWDRLPKVFSGSELVIAKAVLRQLGRANDDGLEIEALSNLAAGALSQSETLDETEFDYVLEVLSHDGYLFRPPDGPGRMQFFTNVLRDYWRRRHV